MKKKHKMDPARWCIGICGKEKDLCNERVPTGQRFHSRGQSTSLIPMRIAGGYIQVKRKEEEA